jgi:hypothetical protein
VRYSTVTRYLYEVKFHLSTEGASGADNQKPVDGANEAVLSALNETPFASVRLLSRLTDLPPTTDLPSPDSLPWVQRASSVLGAPCSVKWAESSANDSASAAVANVESAVRPSLA